MSELKTRFIDDTYVEYYNTGKHDLAQIYLKSEADKVIAEKDAEIEKLKAIRKVHVEAIASMEAGLHQDEKELRHHKYKRCLAMAEMCEARYNYLNCLENWRMTDKEYQQAIGDYWDRWHNRWLELAEKFKEGV